MKTVLHGWSFTSSNNRDKFWKCSNYIFVVYQSSLKLYSLTLNACFLFFRTPHFFHPARGKRRYTRVAINHQTKRNRRKEQVLRRFIITKYLSHKSKHEPVKDELRLHHLTTTTTALDSKIIRQYNP